MRRVLRLLPLATCLVSCTQGDPRCNVDSCNTLLQCGATLEGSAGEAASCNSEAFDAGYDAEDAGLHSCVRACEADGQGGLLQCVTDNFTVASCHAIALDGGMLGASFNAVEATCLPSDADAGCGMACMACTGPCDNAEQACYQTCGAVADAGACYDCAFGCAQTFKTCNDACLAS